MTYDPHRPTSYGATEREMAGDTEQNPVDAMRDKAQETVDNIKDRAQEVSSQVADKADSATTRIGTKMTDAAQTIRERAPSSGPVSEVADTAAQTMERAGTYLQEQDLAGMRADLEGVIRQHPIESLLVGFGVGYLLARSMRR